MNIFIQIFHIFFLFYFKNKSTIFVFTLFVFKEKRGEEKREFSLIWLPHMEIFSFTASKSFKP